jgi:hypothetical protein
MVLPEHGFIVWILTTDFGGRFKPSASQQRGIVEIPEFMRSEWQTELPLIHQKLRLLDNPDV